MMTLTPGLRYDMPATFGPSPIPDRTFVTDAGALVLTFETLAEAVRPLVPRHFSVPERPMISVAYVYYRDVDYLGGRGYNEIVVTVGAEHGEGDAKIAAGYSLILWVDQIGALLAGREYMGLPKLFGTIPELEFDGERAHFTCHEYDALLLEGAAAGLSPVPGDRLAKMNDRAGEVSTFGWKYIAGPGGTAHIDCPMVNVMRWSYKSAWAGTGSVRFHMRDRREAPLSYQAVSILSALPQIGAIKAFYGRGDATIDRTATRFA
ncbi:Acetoacetate decarboxylase [Sphingobium faniae]|nr:Acetoacetate decarboxylase [Sphingobium faniae]